MRTVDVRPDSDGVPPFPRAAGAPTALQRLVGSGDRIGLFVLPFLVVGLALNIAFPSAFSVGGPPAALRVIALVFLVAGVVVWAWSVALILIKVPRCELITTGPYALAKHPLYTSVALLVLPWVGFLLDSWLGVGLGVALYIGSRRFAPREEATSPRPSVPPGWSTGTTSHCAGCSVLVRASAATGPVSPAPRRSPCESR